MTRDAAVEVWRGELLESVHEADVVVVRTHRGRWLRVAWHGRPEQPTLLRSAWKPLQAVIAYECGLREKFQLHPGAAELAIMAASHGATEAQRAAVASLLAKAGLDEAALRCGVHEPLSAEGRAAAAGQPTAIFGNCSGKHAGMLAACVARGWSTDDYLSPDHPLQQLVRQRLAEIMGLPTEAVGVAVDGCGLPTFAAPLEAAAFGFAQLSDQVDGADREPFAAVALAMRRQPELLGDPDGFNVKLMQVAPHVIGKSGAEGVFAVAVPEAELGLVVKIRDGAQRAVPPVVISALQQLGVLTEAQLAALQPFAEPVVTTLAGEPAGRLTACLKLMR